MSYLDVWLKPNFFVLGRIWLVFQPSTLQGVNVKHLVRLPEGAPQFNF